MKIIILAAGKGKRLRPLTNYKPKCLVKYNNKPIIDYIIDSIDESSIDDIVIVNGYMRESLETHFKNREFNFCFNPIFNSTNMLYSLFCAENFLDDDVIISYSDIIYNTDILNKLIDCKFDIGVVIDKNWKELWSLRMDNPLEDVESLKIVDNKITEIGFKSSDITEIQGQYIGLIKFSKSKITEIKTFYKSLNLKTKYYGQYINQMYLTTFLQLLIDNDIEINPVYINGGWIEIDSIQDLENYNKKGIKF
tara:strand:+ start:23692 stop:24444 length:753 start_codon:yes stop_codon:yes gene_type:complete